MRIFISYRRDDDAGHAGRLDDHLLDRFGRGSVFMDVESIEAGADFTEAIGSAIGGSEAVLVLIGPGWLDARSTEGTRRLDDPEDFVRLEIEAALASEVRVIPVLVGGASMPAGSELPASIGGLARRNAVELQDRRWREDVDALVDVLEGRERGGVGNLPVQPTPFLGRERELAEITELLRRQEVRLLTLTGPGGIGKTRLAIQAATKLAHTYPGGAWFVGLAALTDPDLVLVEIARVLEIREAAEERLVAAIAERLARGRTLMVLDNLEQLLPAASAPISELSAVAPALELLASSREPLHLGAEREYPVPVLSDAEAVALFVMRASAFVPGFEPREDAQRAAVAEICERLDRLPLAIELAAARVRLLPPVDLLRRLEQRLPLLTGGALDAAERQRTLRATIAWSYDLLSPDERELFERLAVFVGGWTIEAAEVVCNADLDTLQSLVERSLVRLEGPRFQMLETIREFALELFEGRRDAEALRRRHAERFLAEAEAAASELKGPEQMEWFDRLEAEIDNHRAALRWALDGADPDLGLRLIVELFWVWFLRRPLLETRQWLAEALERASPLPSDARAWALSEAGILAEEQGEYAASLLEESIHVAREAGTLATQAFAITSLAIRLPADRVHEMGPLAVEAVALARASGDHWVLAIALNHLGEAYREGGDTRRATSSYEESLGVLRDVGDSSRVALVRSNLAETSIVAGDLARARALATESLDEAQALGDRRHTSFAQEVLGWVALGQGDLLEANDRLRAALILARDQGFTRFALAVLIGLAGVAAATGDAVRAARLDAAATRYEPILGHQPTAADSGIHRRYLDDLRAETDPAIWESAAREGNAMSLEEAIAYALSP